MSKKILSTFEKEMQNTSFREQFEQEYKEFLLSEIIIALMENDGQSVRNLASEAGLSPTVIQNIRSGKQTDVKLKNFINISHACGFDVVLQKNKERIYL
jgi:lambda repressor-like predicted transcriptional regulator